MNNRDLLGGLLLIAIALFFGVQSLQYGVGKLDNLGAGLFPLLISGLLIILGAANVIRSRYAVRVPASFNLRGIASVIAALVAFVTLSEFGNMILGIIALVLFATMGTPPFSLRRVGGLSVGLVLIAFVFQRVFQLALPLY